MRSGNETTSKCHREDRHTRLQQQMPRAGQAQAEIITRWRLTDIFLEESLQLPRRESDTIRKLGTRQRLFDILLHRRDNGENAQAGGEMGEMIIKSDGNIREYYNLPQATADTVRDGWIYTGDCGWIDEDGFIFIVDRKKDMLKTSGYQVWPREIEEVIATHPAVLEVGVAGIPDADKGEVAHALDLHLYIDDKDENCVDVRVKSPRTRFCIVRSSDSLAFS